MTSHQAEQVMGIDCQSGDEKKKIRINKKARILIFGLFYTIKILG
jgi:hypothetical protein